MAEILAAMEDAARDEEGRLLQEARAEAERLLDTARADVAAARDRHFSRASVAAEAQRARLHGAGALAIDRARARVRDDFVRKAFEAATSVLRGARGTSDYPDALIALVAEALEHFPPDQPLSVRCDPRDGAAIRALLQGSGRTVSLQETLNDWGGLVVEDAIGRVVVDNTLERRLERAREVLWPDVVAELSDSMGQAPTEGSPQADESPPALAHV